MTDRFICPICLQPVSRRPDAPNRVPSPDGDDRWAHRSCVEKTPEEELLDSIFGPGRGRERISTDRLAAAIGHVTTLERTAAGFGWRCSCGMTGYASDRSNQSAQNEDARKHKRFEAAR